VETPPEKSKMERKDGTEQQPTVSNSEEDRAMKRKFGYAMGPNAYGNVGTGGPELGKQEQVQGIQDDSAPGQPVATRAKQKRKVTDKHRETNRLSAARSRMLKKMRQFALEQTNQYLRQQNEQLTNQIKSMKEEEQLMGAQNKNLLEANKDLLQKFLAIFQHHKSKLGGIEGIEASTEKDIQEVQKLLEEVRTLSAPRLSQHFTLWKRTSGC